MTQARNLETLVAPSPELIAGYPGVSEPLVEELYKRTTRQNTLEYLELLWEKRRLLARTAVFGFVVMAVVAFLIPKRYQATTRLMPPDTQSGAGMAMLAALSGPGGGMGGLGALAGDVLGLKTSGGLFVGILGSSTVEDHIIQKFDLQKVYGARTIEAARRALGERTGIAEDRKSGIISITIVDRDPARAAAIAQEYSAELNLVVNQLNTSASHRERVFLEERLAQVKQSLESAEKDFGEFASKNTAIDIKEQGKSMVEAAATLQGQLMAAESELEGMRKIYAEGNVRIKSLRARIEELRKQLGKLGGESGTLADMPDGNTSYPAIRKLPLLGVPYADLYRETKVQEAVFETLTKEYELAKVLEAREIPSVKVLDPSKAPEEKSYPPRLQFAIVGAVLAGLICAGVLALRHRWDRISDGDPWKKFARHVFITTKSAVPGNNGNASQAKFWQKFGSRNSRSA